jgi:excisionase family DNA binding protein
MNNFTPNEQNVKYLSVTEAAEYLGIHPDTLRKWDNDGYFSPSMRIGSRRDRRYSAQELDQFVAKGGVK